MWLAPAVIVFLGLAGKHPEKIERQLVPLLGHAHVAPRAISSADRASIVRHADGSREIVQQLHVDGVVAGALIESGGTLALRVVIYDGEGNLKSLGETPIGGRTLSKDELEVLGENLGEEIGGIAARVAKAAPKREPTPEPEIEMDPVAEAEPVSKPEPAHPAQVAAADAPAETSDHSDGVSLDDVAALNATSDDASPMAGVTASAPGDLHLHATAGLGLAGRSFSGPSTLTGYSSSPVGTVRVEAGLAPTAHLALSAMAERALEMASPVGAEMAATSMSRWEVTAAYTVTRGAFALAPTVGIGQRDFSIASTDPQRSPDASYGYLVFGAAAALPLGGRVVLRGLAAFEPVTGGDEPTAMAFGAATRWAVDAGAGLDVKLFPHVTARAAVDYQRFAWAWNAAGARGADGAVDSYPSGTLSLGAEY